ncbi:phage terminase [Klebsiella pneumoniae subsp. ozaenae]|uniref:Phage terminase n=1 Tax=Klebsiella pneumoniae subsp. ozaenae TaxID=574 RepID=A0A378BZR0_KLEPO|nr:phage terminase [Klebsiella pneumoniae subsp. ozaenae]
MVTVSREQELLRSQSASAILAGEFDADQVLLPYQRRWIADPAQLKIAEKSRRTGLTWAEAAEAALNGSMSVSAGGCDTFYVGTTKDMAREFIDACAMWAKAYDWAASDIGEEVLEDEDKDILVYVINFASGFKIKALSSNPSNLRGMQGNVIIDEAAFQKDLAAVLKAALALTMWGSKVRLISTHNGIENLFNTIITDSRAGKKRYSVHRIDIELAINEGCTVVSARSPKRRGHLMLRMNGWRTCSVIQRPKKTPARNTMRAKKRRWDLSGPFRSRTSSAWFRSRSALHRHDRIQRHPRRNTRTGNAGMAGEGCPA